MTIPNQRLFLILLGVPFLLLIPFIAMQFTNEVNWSGFDFLIMGFLLMSTGLVCELILRLVRSHKQRFFLVLVVFGLFLLTWAELAVGIFGTPFAGN
ncbi:hypothetical protein [Flexithrix dorotheae]|uniref:hypothetical protein n=1 Tax=Flexithrix dorotheae TaxID=70993 RepID=UPI0003A8B807|nr:hypothetical protein [Flexithrix dorotheae]